MGTRKQKLIGTFKLSVNNVRLVAETGVGAYAGAFVFQPSDGGTHKMIVGIGDRPWKDVLSSVIHEAMEMGLHTTGSGYMRTHTPRETTDTYTFVASHAAFDSCCDWTAAFLADCAPALRGAWDAANAKPKPRWKKAKTPHA